MSGANLLFKDEVYAIIGAAIEVHRILGPGFLEPIYQEEMEVECQRQGVPFVAQAQIKIHYKDVVLHKKYEPDLLCYGEIVAELKACSQLIDEHRAQLLNYLAATKMRVGLLVNFGSRGRLEWERFVV